jgi:hypothetical protein
MGRKWHAMYGRDHGPRNSDPAYTEAVTKSANTGNPTPGPPFMNAWDNIGGTYEGHTRPDPTRPDPTRPDPTRFRLIVGGPSERAALTGVQRRRQNRRRHRRTHPVILT